MHKIVDIKGVWEHGRPHAHIQVSMTVGNKTAVSNMIIDERSGFVELVIKGRSAVDPYRTNRIIVRIVDREYIDHMITQLERECLRVLNQEMTTEFRMNEVY